MDILVTTVFIVFLMVISAIDIKTGMIFDKSLIPMALIAVIFDLGGLLVPIDSAVIGAFVAGFIFIIIFKISRGGMGGGDVKFAFVLGLWLGADKIIAAIFLSSIFGAIAAIIIYAIKRDSKIKMPFAPAMSLGAATAFFIDENYIISVLNIFL